MLSAIRPGLSRLRRDGRATAVIETAILLPTVLFVGLAGIELTNLTLSHMQISQAASTLADNASRVSIDAGATLPQIREVDANELLQAVLDRHAGIELKTHGRVILTSLERNSDGGQWIHWQRCIGDKLAVSRYGAEGTGASGTSFPGMGEAAQLVKAPPRGAVMFVEIVYDYQPIAYGQWLGPKQLRYSSSFMVRDERDLSQIYNPAPTAPVARCN